MMSLGEGPKIKVGDYIVIQRQKYTKLQKFGNLDATATLGKDQLELKGLLDHPYGATFKMCPKEELAKSHRGRQKLYSLELCNELEMRNIREVLGISTSGEDNRNIIDNGDSQALKPEDIDKLRDELSESTKIIEKIVENSKTFHNKTEYSQEKYLRKKEKKYFEYIQIRQPTIRLISEIHYRQDADKIMGLRVDTLSQLICYSGVSAFGNYLLFESGSNGILPATFLNAMGANTEAKLIHMHPGNVPQKLAVQALNLPEEQLERCISVNIYSVLREFYQSGENFENSNLGADLIEPNAKKQKLNDEDKKTPRESADDDVTQSLQKWQLQNKRAVCVMREKFDSLVIAAKEHPSNLINELLPLVKPSRPVVIFSLCKEVLMQLYVDLKTTSKVSNLHLTSNWLRMYQILPNRTHPEVNMQANSGYLLTGYTLC